MEEPIRKHESSPDGTSPPEPLQDPAPGYQQQQKEASSLTLHHVHLAFESSGKPFSCGFAFCDGQGCSPLPQGVKAAALEANLIQCTWGHRKDVSVLEVLCVAHGGGPALHALPPPEGDSRAYEAQHKECLEEHTALAIRLDAAHELLLAPVRTLKSDGSTAPVFWGFVLCPGMASVACGLLERGQLALIFDLDETLVVAHTSTTVEDRRADCMQLRGKVLDELWASNTTDMTPKKRQALEAEASRLQKEAELLGVDAELLNQYAASNTVRVQGRLFTPRLETVVLEDGMSIQRPVIRLKDSQVILTRINPADRRSSIIIRVRPGWKELHNLLAGNVDAPKFEVYACTAAERQYALEVWRLLDPSAVLIPVHLRQRRLVNVGGRRLKTLPNALGLLPQGEEIPPGMTLEAMEQQPAAGDASRQLPLAVVVDDRTVVWEPASRPHILQVIPWAHYRDKSSRLVHANTRTAALSERELVRVRNAVMQLHADVYQCIRQELRPCMGAIAAEGAPEAAVAGAAAADAASPAAVTGTAAPEVPRASPRGALPLPALGAAALLQDPRWASTYRMPDPADPLYEPPPLAPTTAPAPPLPTPTPALADAAGSPAPAPVPVQILGQPAREGEAPAPAPASTSSGGDEAASAGASTAPAAQPGPSKDPSHTRPLKPPSNPPSRGHSVQPTAGPRPTIKDVSAWSLEALMMGAGEQEEEVEEEVEEGHGEGEGKEEGGGSGRGGGESEGRGWGGADGAAPAASAPRPPQAAAAPAAAPAAPAPAAAAAAAAASRSGAAPTDPPQGAPGSSRQQQQQQQQQQLQQQWQGAAGGTAGLQGKRKRATCSHPPQQEMVELDNESDMVSSGVSSFSSSGEEEEEEEEEKGMEEEKQSLSEEDLRPQRKKTRQQAVVAAAATAAAAAAVRGAASRSDKVAAGRQGERGTAAASLEDDAASSSSSSSSEDEDGWS